MNPRIEPDVKVKSADVFKIAVKLTLSKLQRS